VPQGPAFDLCACWMLPAFPLSVSIEFGLNSRNTPPTDSTLLNDRPSENTHIGGLQKYVRLAATKEYHVKTFVAIPVRRIGKVIRNS